MKNTPIADFQKRIQNGEYVQVGVDDDGNPLFQSFAAATDVLASIADSVAARRKAPASGSRRSNVGGIAVQLTNRISS